MSFGASRRIDRGEILRFAQDDDTRQAGSLPHEETYPRNSLLFGIVWIAIRQVTPCFERDFALESLVAARDFELHFSARSLGAHHFDQVFEFAKRLAVTLDDDITRLDASLRRRPNCPASVARS